jgi:hypothetical protein
VNQIDKMTEAECELYSSSVRGTIRGIASHSAKNDHGTIVERGTHDKLLSESGLYSRLHEIQFRPQITQI